MALAKRLLQSSVTTEFPPVAMLSRPTVFFEKNSAFWRRKNVFLIGPNLSLAIDYDPNRSMKITGYRCNRSLERRVDDPLNNGSQRIQNAVEFAVSFGADDSNILYILKYEFWPSLRIMLDLIKPWT